MRIVTLVRLQNFKPISTDERLHDVQDSIRYYHLRKEANPNRNPGRKYKNEDNTDKWRKRYYDCRLVGHGMMEWSRDILEELRVANFLVRSYTGINKEDIQTLLSFTQRSQPQQKPRKKIQE
jgi:hypothetical protein